MKKLLSLLSVLTISGTAVPTVIAASTYQKTCGQKVKETVEEVSVVGALALAPEGTAGGLAIGAAVGTSVLPLVGTVIGGAVGAVIGTITAATVGAGIGAAGGRCLWWL